MLLGTQLLELSFDQLIQSLRHARFNILQPHFQFPSSIYLFNQAALHHIEQDIHHKERVAPGMAINQVRKSFGKVSVREVNLQVFRDIRLFQSFQVDFVAQIVEH